VVVGWVDLDGVRAVVAVARQLVKSLLAVERVDTAVVDDAVRLALLPFDTFVVGGMAVVPQVADGRAVVADDVAARLQECGLFEFGDLPIVAELVLREPPFGIGLQPVVGAEAALCRVAGFRDAPVRLRPVVSMHDAVGDEVISNHFAVSSVLTLSLVGVTSSRGLVGEGG